MFVLFINKTFHLHVFTVLYSLLQQSDAPTLIHCLMENCTMRILCTRVPSTILVMKGKAIMWLHLCHLLSQPPCCWCASDHYFNIPLICQCLTSNAPNLTLSIYLQWAWTDWMIWLLCTGTSWLEPALLSALPMELGAHQDQSASVCHPRHKIKKKAKNIQLLSYIFCGFRRQARNRIMLSLHLILGQWKHICTHKQQKKTNSYFPCMHYMPMHINCHILSLLS